ncbi:TraR/DksA C4-type zinc finger protein [Candidatus Nomurabacteria bacterium]|nr:TraR/DksA C4-type zinc finger protein [Candidatus Nomurabacteria bacterium]
MFDLKYWQEKLTAEKTDLESQLSKVGRINPQNKTDWEVKPLDGSETAFRDEVADDLEEMDEREEIERGLEERLHQVLEALDRIANNKFGICEVGGEAIEEERLMTNPAARTCKAHIDAR